MMRYSVTGESTRVGLLQSSRARFPHRFDSCHHDIARILSASPDWLWAIYCSSVLHLFQALGHILLCPDLVVWKRRAGLCQHSNLHLLINFLLISFILMWTWLRVWKSSLQLTSNWLLIIIWIDGAHQSKLYDRLLCHSNHPLQSSEAMGWKGHRSVPHGLDLTHWMGEYIGAWAICIALCITDKRKESHLVDHQHYIYPSQMGPSLTP